MIPVIPGLDLSIYICSKLKERTMKARTLLNILTLSSNIYLMSKDRELRQRLYSVLDLHGREEGPGEEEVEEEDEETFFANLVKKIEDTKKEMEKGLEHIAESVYNRMHIAHTSQVRDLEKELDALRKAQLGLETKLFELEQKKER